MGEGEGGRKEKRAGKREGRGEEMREEDEEGAVVDGKKRRGRRCT